MLTIADLRQDQIQKAGNLMARAFAHDPILTYVLNDPRLWLAGRSNCGYGPEDWPAALWAPGGSRNGSTSMRS